MKALKLEYTLSQLTAGGGLMLDKEHSVPAISIYIEGKALVKRIKPEIFACSQIEQIYAVYLDRDADIEYARLIEKFGDVATPQEIEVPDSLLDWAKDVYSARNPPDGVNELLSYV
ncbi:MAG: hypothetical protein KAI53_01820 [Candidatus Aenigmarchaeota archaeon]|nr:hypothetical protein [Candidatus Aenigmarchaeota archaeon]